MDSTRGDWLNFQARACSRPPLPTSRMRTGSIVAFLVNVDFVVRNWGRMNVIILPPENKILAERGALEGSVSHVALTVLGMENSTSRKKTQIDLHACF